MIIEDLNRLEKKYNLVYADPPWKQNRGGKKAVRPDSSGKELDYDTLSLDGIKEHLQQVVKACDNNCILFLWTIDKYLIDAQKIAEGLGFKLHARMIWNKVTGIPAAFTVRYGHEYLLYMYKGKLLPVAKEQRGKIHTVFTEQVTKHSKKPQIAYEIIEKLYPETTRIELYARNTRKNWDSWGNEVYNLNF